MQIRARLTNALTQVGERALRGVSASSPWTNTYGLARTLLAGATALTLLFNTTAVIFHAEHATSPSCEGLAGHVSFFCVTPVSQLHWMQLLAAALLLLVASGWRPRYTGVLHWWISYSAFSSVRLGDGGEQAAAVITLLLIPITLTDPRKWHWDVSAKPQGARAPYTALIAWIALFTLQLQVSFIYLDACIEKLHVPEWLDGTVMYYVLSSNYFGAPSWLMWILRPIITSSLVVLLTWPSLVLEFSLGVNLLMKKSARRVLFYLGAAFHVAIALTIGIPTFAVIMIGTLLLGVVPLGDGLAGLRLRFPAVRASGSVAADGAASAT